jgi:hypothetical protein
MVKYFIVFLMLCTGLSSMGQGAIQKKRRLNDKLFFGTGLGLQFGSNTAIEMTPMLGYQPVDNLYFGLKGKYEYYKNNNYNTATSVYGGSVFGTYAFFGAVLAYAEYEALSLESAYFDPLQVYGSGNRYWMNTPLVGGGYLQSFGGRSKVMILLLWNLNKTYDTYYSNPIVRLSFMF